MLLLLPLLLALFSCGAFAESMRQERDSLADSLTHSFSHEIYHPRPAKRAGGTYYKPIPKVYHDHYDEGPRYGYHTFHVPKYDYQDRGHTHYKERLAYFKDHDKHQKLKQKKLLDRTLESLEEATDLLTLAKKRHLDKKRPTEPPIKVVPTESPQQIIQGVQSQLFNLQVQLSQTQLSTSQVTSTAAATGQQGPVIVSVGG